MFHRCNNIHPNIFLFHLNNNSIYFLPQLFHLKFYNNYKKVNSFLLLMDNNPNYKFCKVVIQHQKQDIFPGLGHIPHPHFYIFFHFHILVLSHNLDLNHLYILLHSCILIYHNSLFYFSDFFRNYHSIFFLPHLRKEKNYHI